MGGVCRARGMTSPETLQQPQAHREGGSAESSVSKGAGVRNDCRVTGRDYTVWGPWTTIGGLFSVWWEVIARY